MKYKYFFEISDLLFQVESNKELQIPKCFQPFESTSDQKENGDIELEVVHGVGDVVRCENGEKMNSYTLYIPETLSDKFCNQGNWLSFFKIDSFLAPHYRFFLHASTVIYKGKAYLFSGPSGSGKSSHASIWEKEFGATILNGDKALISVSPEGCRVYGSPVAGSSEIYRNESAPIAAIFLIKKSTRNCVQTISTRKAFLAIYSEAIKSKWDATFNSNILEMAEILQKTTPIHSLECLLEKSAVECILQTLGEKYET